MQIPLKWINELIDVESIDLDDLIEKLTLGGFEVEEIIELEISNEKQLSLDISSTANRSDSLSIQGLSAEIATLLNKPIKISNYSFQDLDWKKKLNNSCKTISTESNCSTFISLIIENIDNFEVPNWVKQKLTSSGINPTNSLLDFQNYILLETGYPFAFYDFNKICSKLNSSNFELSFSKGIDNKKFNASNGLTYTLNSFNTILKADDLPISIAGVIENEDFYYSENTNTLLIEGSIFNAASIRQESRNLGLRTDRSARYEKSLKNTYLIESLYRLISLLRIANPKLICKLHTFTKIAEKHKPSILLRYKVVNEILGPIKTFNKQEFIYLTSEMVQNYLDRLNFTYSYDKSKLTWKVNIPDFRSDDITREIDLIEEIGRLHGFNNFLTDLPKIKTIGNEDLSYITRKKITSCLTNLGLNELIHYSLVNEKTFLENEIKLINPLISDYSNLRSSLLPSLLVTVQENLKQGSLFLEGFEYGHVFSGDISTNFTEKEYVAGIFGGIKTKLTWSDSEKPLTWFEAKGKIERLFKQLNLATYWTNSLSSKNSILHPYRSADVCLINGVKLGIFGQIHPILINQLSLATETYLFEFDMELLQNQIQANKLAIYKEYSLYPKVVKDLSFVIEEETKYESLESTLYCNGTQFLSEINLLDDYRGKSIPEKSKSLCLQLVFQSNDKTLENKQIDNIIKNLQSILVSKFNATIRT